MDLCMCGHEEREHEMAGDRACSHDLMPWQSVGWVECSCEAYRRSPLSAFRGGMRWTRADASDALLLLNCGGAAYAVRNLDPYQLREAARIYVQSARTIATVNPGLAAVQLLAARILRAVRP